MREVIVIGAGLSGLSASYLLNKKGIDVLVLEARERWGGRIETIYAAGNATPVEMGATWFARKHTNLMRLLQELGLPIFKQYQKGIGVFEADMLQEVQLFEVPDSEEEASYRIAGGTSKLTDALARQIGLEHIMLGASIRTITEHKDHIELKTGTGDTYICRKLVLTISPFLIGSQNIIFEPPLPDQLISVMKNTHTWMGDSIKFAVEYAQPFWRDKGYSGTIFSHSGIAVEVYDHSNVTATQFALKGFLRAEASSFNQEERELKCIAQLTRLLGHEAATYLSYTDKVWRQEPYTFSEYEKYMAPHQNNGHPLYSEPFMNGKLYIAGTETSPCFGGYMDGAVYSGLSTAQSIYGYLREGEQLL